LLYLGIRPCKGCRQGDNSEYPAKYVAKASHSPPFENDLIQAFYTKDTSNEKKIAGSGISDIRLTVVFGGLYNGSLSGLQWERSAAVTLDPNPSPGNNLKPLMPLEMILRLGALGLVVLAVIGAFAYAGGWLTPKAVTPSKMIDGFERTAGVHPGFRRNHAKGVCVGGFFESNGKGASLSKASIFQTGRVDVLGRFALAGGQPYQADAPNTVRSMALLFKLAGGEEWRTGMNNIPVFVVNTPEGFYEQILASAPDPATGKPDPEKMKAFLAKHPEFARAIAAIKSQPVSSGFDNSTYNSLDAFRFISASGDSTPVRWAMAPVQAFEVFPTTQPAQENKNFLFDALIALIHQHPLQWHLIVTIGQPGDPTSDATIAWPGSREHVDVGTLTIDRVESEETSPVRDINFDPLVLPVGIAASDDPLLSARSAAYAQSFTRREGEAKQPSAVTAAETGK
jgi:catalase